MEVAISSIGTVFKKSLSKQVNTPFKLKRKNVEVAKLNDRKLKLGDHFSAFGWGSNQKVQCSASVKQCPLGLAESFCRHG